MKKYIWALRYIKVTTMTFVYSFIARIRLRLSGVRIGHNLDVNGWLYLIIHPECEVTLGNFVRLNSGFERNLIGGERGLGIQVGRKAKLEVGDHVGISNSTIVCMEEIIIDDDVLIGGGCNIYDTDFHGIDPLNRRIYTTTSVNTAPIHIKKNSFIGGHSIVLKGVTIGEGAIVGAGSVVTRNIPDFEVWAGNPVHKVADVERKTPG